MCLFHLLCQRRLRVSRHRRDDLFSRRVSISAILKDLAVLNVAMMLVFAYRIGAHNLHTMIQRHVQIDEEVSLTLPTVELLVNSHGVPALLRKSELLERLVDLIGGAFFQTHRSFEIGARLAF